MARRKTPEAKQAEADADEKRKRQTVAQKWLAAIGKRRRKEKTWRDQAEKVLRRYRDDRDMDVNAAKFSILWANTEVMKPAIFARMPVPDVRRRFLTKDPVARTAATIMERALSFTMDTQDFKDTLDRVLEDYLLPGRAQAVVTYKPYFKQERRAVEPLPPGEHDDPTAEKAYPPDTLTDEQGGYTMVESKLYEEVRIRYQPWRYYVFGWAQQREGVPWEAYGDLLSEEDVREQFPHFKDWKKIPYSDSYDREDKDRDPAADAEKKALVWRVWDKSSRKVVSVAEGYTDGPLNIEDDPLGLEEFFPAPEPMYSLRTNGNDLPKPEFLMYQDQADELDLLVARQRALASALKYRGVYDKQLDELAKISDLVKSPDNTFIPVANFAALAEKGGLEALLDTLPIEEIQQALVWITERIDLLKQEIYEIYGISDIVRGATKASETLGAQQLKAQYSGMRVTTRQERFQRFIRDILRKAGEVEVEHFSPDTLRIMSGIQVLPDAEYAQAKEQHQLDSGAVAESTFLAACQMLKQDKLRGFKIDIETDSTIPIDRDNEQQNRVMFMQAVGQYLQGVIPAVESGAIPIKMAREGLLFVVRGFKVGTELEETLEELGTDQDEAQQLQQLKQAQAQAQQQLQALQEENTQLKTDAQTKARQAQLDMEIDKAKSASDIQISQQAAANDEQIKARDAAHDAHIKELSAQHDARIKEHQSRADEATRQREQFAKDTQTAAKESQATAGDGNKRLDALIKGQQAQTEAMKSIAENQSAQTEALMALVQHMSKPRSRKGIAMLPSGPIEMSMTEQ